MKTFLQNRMSTSRKKEEEKEKKFLGKLSYRLDYDFDKNAVGFIKK